MPVDDAFSRHDMAILYDSFNGHGLDRDFYLSLAKAPCRILDVGCGTGLLTLPLAEQGHQVTGVEPGAGMLSVARAKDRAGLVNWVAATAEDFDVALRFDLAIMTAHVFQVFLDDAQTLSALSNIHRHMAAGGKLVFESRNPLVREWQSWTRYDTLETREIDGIGPVEVYYQVTKVDGEHVTFDAVFKLLETGEKRISQSTLRFPSHAQIVQVLKQAGFGKIETLGWWDRSAFEQDSREIIITAYA
ncbi:methyltransferase domain-containing protein [Rhizobium oryzicola]|uniref:Methyltransferase domain-containing protein n=1 Tax=Rhizobium oryzicola TaxID=1232668 RepID=A0ABT8SQR1_9HYPH|nr:class I SAM-dependent methyltransferase [Rhizobium oryzicola]MDO1580783.1 methyltransferase domain-containing protein [Rhizobium oryzicola]